MSISSFLSFSHSINDFNATTAKARLPVSARLPARLDGDWQKFVDHMLKSWDDITRCRTSACAFVERHMQLSVADPSFSIATTFSYATYVCGGVSLVLCMAMRRHIEFIRRNHESRWNWHSVTERNAESPFIATSTLLVAPIAWINWSYVSFGMFAISLLWCLLSSGSMSTYVADAILDSRGINPTSEGNVGSTAAATQGVPVSALACALIIVIGATGLVHTAFILVHFYQLGYPPPRATRSRTRKAASRSRSRHSEGSIYEEPKDDINSTSSTV
ncbi:uncharacterized protein PHACADRAFT_30500 [Phanerochaete carnosa HHB-10118-sp]|uniref:Uncharacterized protein n=1 Tax=Phanerochaete carnosa (strain HHB-10118-sp) TaxID=650164 RepID=K5UU38_PHACS|nr:uncharacterized protein PHACADRAFT_30500 [Phanerochaete carnosa HHB-10118-sp]EKM53506.1 hypothetical protein PHACADRAFT_30500 [Phanerochaete carnosa HHB-10118-sp]